jgi:hypothetical protein
MTDEFYIGWQNQAPVVIARHVRKTVVSLLVLLFVLAGIISFAQRTISVSVFEWGTLKNFKGTLKLDPYPHLLVQRPGLNGSQSAYYLVAPFKFGLNPVSLASLDGKAVSLKGTLIYRGNQTMIEADPESIKLAADQASVSHLSRDNSMSALQHSNTPIIQVATSSPGTPSSSLVTLQGEIVDSKCYLGVMNPGQLTPHRACAVRCISGGIPPILLVRQHQGPPLYFLLVSSDGHQVNKQVLDMVAEPIEITGEVIRQGELSILRADPATYRPIAR